MTASTLIGRQIGDYRVVSLLGEGGMGQVYKGQHVSLGQVVAIKSLHSALMNNQSARDRFVREAQALARLNHPNIISLLNFINDDTGCFIVMEFAEGEDLEQKISRMGLVPPEQCLPWFVQACRALSYAHKQGIIHRDIKPSNLFVHPSGTTKLLDFGTAKLVDAKRLTQQGMTLGTVIYMSKEQLLGKPLDPRSDLYSLGVTLYECVTGQLPFYDQEERKLIKKIAKEDPVPPSRHYPGISPQLEAVILKAMAKEPEQRFQDADEFEAALLPLAGSGSGVIPGAVALPSPRPSAPAGPSAPTPAAPAPVQAPTVALLNPVVVAGLVLLILALGGGLPFALLSKRSDLRLGAGIFAGAAGLIGAVLMLVGLFRALSRPAAAAGGGGGGGDPFAGPGGGADPFTPPGQTGRLGSVAGGKCASCGRTMLEGMKVCPFCNPQAAAAANQVGPTLTVNPDQAARAFGPAPTPPAPAPVGQAAASATVRITDGPDRGQVLTLPARGEFTIGRSPNASLTLNDPGVSGLHAKIVCDPSGYVVEDTGSRNGVFVNNEKVQRRPLKTGDLIVVGSTRLMITF